MREVVIATLYKSGGIWTQDTLVKDEYIRKKTTAVIIMEASRI